MEKHYNNDYTDGSKYEINKVGFIVIFLYWLEEELSNAFRHSEMLAIKKALGYIYDTHCKQWIITDFHIC